MYFELPLRKATDEPDTGPLAALKVAWRRGVEVHLCDSDKLFGEYFPHSHQPATPADLKTIVWLLKNLKEKHGFFAIAFGGPDPLQHPDFARASRAAQRLGFTSITLITHGMYLPEGVSEIRRLLDGVTRVLLKRYPPPKEATATKTPPDARTAYADILAKLQQADVPVTPWIICDSDAARWVPGAIREAAEAGVDSLVLGYPLGGIRRGEKVDFPDIEALRDTLVPTKYDLYERSFDTGLLDFPPCGLSYGDPLPFVILPELPMAPVSAFAGSPDGFEPMSRLRYRSHVGLLPCHCRQIVAGCPRLPAAYLLSGEREQPKPLPVDYIQMSQCEEVRVLVRTVMVCNQHCGFCFIAENLPSPTIEEIRHRIATLSPHVLTLSGGEPSLAPDLPKLVRWAKNTGVPKVIIQTNAMLYASRSLARSLIEAGADEAFVSLHSDLAQTSERLTGLPGSFEKTLQGIRNLLELPEGVVLNHVIQEDNYRDLPRYVRWVLETFDVPKVRLTVNFSFIWFQSEQELKSRGGKLPRLSDVKPYLKEALNLCLEANLPISGMETPCGIPICFMDGDTRFYPPFTPIQPDPDFVKADGCRNCRYDACCFGLRRVYARLHGTGELKPIPADGRKKRP